MSKARALIVDDEPDILDLMRITFARMGVGAHGVGTLAAAYQALRAERFDFCLTDMRLPDGDGIDLVRHATEHYPTMPIAMATAYGNMESAVAAMKAGAFDFVSKPLDLRVLRELTAAALRLRPDAPSTVPTAELLGQSPAIEALRALIVKLARNQAPVCIHGESGTGKELVARLIHRLGPRADRPFVPVNCGAIPSELVESELFGHRKGSFTGAIADKTGLFQAAHGGTLFLDEIADLPLATQVKLLRAIQEKSVRPVGAEREIPVDVRIVSASHRRLEDEVARGAFRQDLFYRINVIELSIPPLRERIDDLPVLVAHLLPRIAAQSGSPARRLSPAAWARLRTHAFPGNVRELENILERATALSERDTLEVEDLGLPAAEAPPSAPRVALAEQLDRLERELLAHTLAQAHGDLAAAARDLGLAPRSLRYRLTRLGMQDTGSESVCIKEHKP